MGTGRLAAGCPCVYCSLFFRHCFITVTGIRLRFHKPLINPRQVSTDPVVLHFHKVIRQLGLPTGHWMGRKVAVVLFESEQTHAGEPGSVLLSV